MEWSTDEVLEFLELYEAEPSIWNPQNADHKDRNMVHDAWKRIQNSISVDCSVTELKKKKENLMATYRKVAMKVINTTVTGVAYKPEWFAYEKMASFLSSIYTPRKIKTSDEDQFSDDVDLDQQDDEDASKNLYSNSSKNTKPNKRPLCYYSTLIPPATNKKPHLDTMRFVDSVNSTFSNREPQQCHDDQYEMFGKHVAAQMREIPLRNFIILQDKIQSLITQARLEFLDDLNVD